MVAPTVGSALTSEAAAVVDTAQVVKEYLDRGRQEVAAGHYQEARFALAIANALNPAAEVLRQLGEVSLKMGYPKEAWVLFMRAFYAAPEGLQREQMRRLLFSLPGARVIAEPLYR